MCTISPKLSKIKCKILLSYNSTYNEINIGHRFGTLRRERVDRNSMNSVLDFQDCVSLSLDYS